MSRQMSCKSRSLALLALAAVLITACAVQPPSSGSDQPLSISSMLASIGGQPGNIDDQVYSFTIQLQNRDRSPIQVYTVEIMLTDPIAERVAARPSPILINQQVLPGAAVEISRTIQFNAQGLSKAQIGSMEPFVSEFKVSTERGTIHVPAPGR